MIKKLISSMLVFSFVGMISCAGRNPVYVPIKNDSDVNMSCDELKNEINATEYTIMEKYYQGKKKTSETVGAAVAGYILIIPFFFMDLKKAEYKEMGNLQERRNYLIEEGKSKNCKGFDSFETDDELMARAQVEYEKKIKEGKEKKPKEPVTINGKPQS